MKTMKVAVSRLANPDVSKEFLVTPFVVAQFEDKFDTTLAQAFGEGGKMSMKQLYWLAHQAEHHHCVMTGEGSVKPFDDWLKELANVEPVEDDVRPFGPGQSDG